MTLGNLIRNTTVQGDVTLSLFHDGEEVATEYIRHADDLHNEDFPKFWKKLDIAYLFASPDGSLHIEFQTED